MGAGGHSLVACLDQRTILTTSTHARGFLSMMEQWRGSASCGTRREKTEPNHQLSASWGSERLAGAGRPTGQATVCLSVRPSVRVPAFQPTTVFHTNRHSQGKKRNFNRCSPSSQTPHVIDTSQAPFYQRLRTTIYTAAHDPPRSPPNL